MEAKTPVGLLDTPRMEGGRNPDATKGVSTWFERMPRHIARGSSESQLRSLEFEVSAGKASVGSNPWSCI